MKHLKIFESFNENIVGSCEKYDIRDYTINDDGSIDTDDLVRLQNLRLDKIPIKFNRAAINFHIESNCITSLENSPKYVGRNFTCQNNKLTTLVGGPTYVGGEYICNDNNLKDLYGFPEAFNGEAYIHYNPVCEIINLIFGSGKHGDPILRSKNIKIRFIHLLNDYHVIRNGNTIIQDRLEEALIGVGVENLSDNLAAGPAISREANNCNWSNVYYNFGIGDSDQDISFQLEYYFSKRTKYYKLV